MAELEFDPFQDATDLLILAALGVVAYILYQVYQAGTSCPSWLSSLGLCTPQGMNAPSQVPGNTTVAQSVGGYDKVDGGVTWSCTGPSGSSNDVCTPMTCDANANCTANGSAVPASQTSTAAATVAAQQPSTIGSWLNGIF